MSALTKTTVTYTGVFAILLLLLLPALGKGDVISNFYDDIGKVLFLLLIILGVLSLLFELLVRKVSFSHMPDFSIRVSVVQIVAQIIMVTYLFPLVIRFDKWGLSYLLFVAVMTYTVVSREKRKSDIPFWLINICCSIVISCTLTALVLIMAVRGLISSPEGTWALLKIILSCAIFGIGSYLNYLQSVRATKK